MLNSSSFPLNSLLQFPFSESNVIFLPVSQVINLDVTPLFLTQIYPQRVIIANFSIPLQPFTFASTHCHHPCLGHTTTSHLDVSTGPHFCHQLFKSGKSKPYWAYSKHIRAIWMPQQFYTIDSTIIPISLIKKQRDQVCMEFLKSHCLESGRS